jgi:hypothetical protein
MTRLRHGAVATFREQLCGFPAGPTAVGAAITYAYRDAEKVLSHFSGFHVVAGAGSRDPFCLPDLRGQ